MTWRHACRLEKRREEKRMGGRPPLMKSRRAVSPSHLPTASPGDRVNFGGGREGIGGRRRQEDMRPVKCVVALVSARPRDRHGIDEWSGSCAWPWLLHAFKCKLTLDPFLVALHPSPPDNATAGARTARLASCGLPAGDVRGCIVHARSMRGGWSSPEYPGASTEQRRSCSTEVQTRDTRQQLRRRSSIQGNCKNRTRVSMNL